MYLMEELKEHCCAVLKTLLKPSNCVGIQTLASSMYFKDLEAAAFSFTLANFEEVASHSAELCQLSASRLTEVLSHDLLNVRTEESLEKVDWY